MKVATSISEIATEINKRSSNIEHITTFTGEDFTPLAPDINQIKLEDIAHALSLICRANGHFVRFFSIAQHSINCAKEANARGLSARVQLACLLHDASEAYLSDVTKPVKKHLTKYIEAEKHLQNLIYNKFLSMPLSNEENAYVKKIDDDMLICEFTTLMKKKVFDCLPTINSQPSFELISFSEVEIEFSRLFAEITKQAISKKQSMTEQIAEIEYSLQSKSKNDVIDCIAKHNITALFEEKQFIKNLSAQIDVAIHAYGILLALPQILDCDEQIEYLSLGAGSTGKPFDLATSKRIAEFKFSKWSKSRNAIRQNNIFKDFLELALVADNRKRKFIYCFDADDIIHFFSNSKRSLKSVLSRNSINKKHDDYQQKYKTVKDFYLDFKNEVNIVGLENLIIVNAGIDSELEKIFK